MFHLKIRAYDNDDDVAGYFFAATMLHCHCSPEGSNAYMLKSISLYAKVYIRWLILAVEDDCRTIRKPVK